MPGTDAEGFDGLTWRVRHPVTWAAVVFTAAAVAAFAVSIEGGRPVRWSVGVGLAAASLVVATVVVLDRVVGPRGVGVAVHVLPGLFVLSVAALLTALEFADRFLPAPIYVALAGLWIVGGSLVLGGVLVSRGSARRLRRVASVGLGASLLWGLLAVGYAVAVLVSRGRNPVPGVTAEAVAAWSLLVVLVGLPSLIFLRDLRATRSAIREGEGGR